MLKKWWQSRTIWAGLATIVMAIAGIAKVVPESVNDILAFGQIISGALTIYFRKTTTVGVGTLFADNRISGARVRMDQ